MPDATAPQPVRWNVCPDCGERHDGGAACHPELQGTPVSSIPAHQKAGYDAVYEVIRAEPGDAWRNATIWRAVEAYRAASEGVHERQVREQVAAEIEALVQEKYPTDIWPEPQSRDDAPDRFAASAKRTAYRNAARIARGES